MDRVNTAKETTLKVYNAAKANPSRTMKLLSCISGLLLVLGGFTGMFNLLNPLKAVISMYNMGFGLLIIATELKSWPIISTFQKRVDVYFHLLSVPRGKGGFYFFIGFLAFCASTEFDLSRVCVLIVAIVGVLHMFKCKGTSAEEADSIGFAGGPSSSGLSGEAGMPEGLTSFAMQVVADNPGMLKAGLAFASQNPEVAKQGMATAFSAGTPGAAAGGSNAPRDFD